MSSTNPLRFKFIAHGPPSVETRREVYSHARQHIERTKRARRTNTLQKTSATIPESPPVSPKLLDDEDHDRRQSKIPASSRQTATSSTIADKSLAPLRHRSSFQAIVTPPTPATTPMPTWSTPTTPLMPTISSSDLSYDELLDYNFDWTSITDYSTRNMLITEQYQSLSYPVSLDLFPQPLVHQLTAPGTPTWHPGSDASVIASGADGLPVAFYFPELEPWDNESFASGMSDMVVASGYLSSQNDIGGAPVTFSGWV